MINQNQHRPGVPDRREPNKLATTNITNELRDAIAGHHPIAQTSNVQGGIIGLPWAFLARIVATGPNGEADFTDERYWARVLIIAPAASDQPIVLFNDNEADPSVIPIVNLSEKPPAGSDEADTLAAGSHGGLSPGDWVYVYSAYDAGGDNANLRFFTIIGGAGRVVFGRITANWTGAHKYKFALYAVDDPDYVLSTTTDLNDDGAHDFASAASYTAIDPYGFPGPAEHYLSVGDHYCGYLMPYKDDFYGKPVVMLISPLPAGCAG